MKKHRAILDPDGVYQGHESVASRLAAADVEVPPDCDLVAGRYRWDSERRAFVPIRDAGRHDLLDEPHTLRSVALGFEAIDKAYPGLLPLETKRWLDWFSKTIDAGVV